MPRRVWPGDVWAYRVSWAVSDGVAYSQRTAFTSRAYRYGYPRYIVYPWGYDWAPAYYYHSRWPGPGYYPRHVPTPRVYGRPRRR